MQLPALREVLGLVSLDGFALVVTCLAVGVTGALAESLSRSRTR